VSSFAWINVALTILWLWVARQIAKEHRRRTVSIAKTRPR
jgi:hypothetical protein